MVQKRCQAKPACASVLRRNSFSHNDLDVLVLLDCYNDYCSGIRCIDFADRLTGVPLMPDKAQQRPVVAVHYCTDNSEADVIIALLRDRGIDAFTNAPIAHDVLPVSAGQLGEVQIYVDQKNAEQAIEIIDEAKTED
jgi:hypothetical protein